MHPVRFLSGAGIKSKSLSDSGRCHPKNRANYSSDAAYCLSGLSPVMTPFALWRFCGDESQLKKVRGNLAVKAMRIARERGFKIKNTTLAGLADAALLQLIQTTCDSCQGHPEEIRGDDVTTCEYCKGLGKNPISNRKIAEASGISHKAYSENHAVIFKALIHLLHEWESVVITHVQSRMGF